MSGLNSLAYQYDDKFEEIEKEKQKKINALWAEIDKISEFTSSLFDVCTCEGEYKFKDGSILGVDEDGCLEIIA